MKKLDETPEVAGRTKNLRRLPMLIVVAVAAVVLGIFEIGKPVLTEDTLLNGFYTMTITRLVGAAVFLVLIGYEGYHVLNPVRKPLGRSLLIALPALAVAINNFPFYALISGNATVVYGWEHIFWCAAECVSVGLFEEAAFRGVLLLMICQKKRNTNLNLFVSIVLSSAVFAVIHMANLLMGAGIGGVLQQIGYSFLIGAMCSVVLYKTANLWLCVLLHSVFNFGGRFFDLCEGNMWDNPTVVITIALAIAVAMYMIVMLFTMDPGEVDRIYDNGEVRRKPAVFLKNFESHRVRFVMKRVLPCTILWVIITAVLIFWGEPIFQTNNLAFRIVCYVIVLLVPFLATGIPLELIDRTFYGTIKKVMVTTTAEHDALSRPQRAHVYTSKNTIRLTVEAPDGKLIRKTVHSGRAEKQEFLDTYHEGDTVLHVYGTHTTVVLPKPSDTTVTCAVCGNSNSVTDDTCRECGHTLIKTLDN